MRSVVAVVVVVLSRCFRLTCTCIFAGRNLTSNVESINNNKNIVLNELGDLIHKKRTHLLNKITRGPVTKYADYGIVSARLCLLLNILISATAFGIFHFARSIVSHAFAYLQLYLLLLINKRYVSITDLFSMLGTH